MDIFELMHPRFYEFVLSRTSAENEGNEQEKMQELVDEYSKQMNIVLMELERDADRREFYKEHDATWGLGLKGAEVLIYMMEDTAGLIKTINDEDHIKDVVRMRLFGKGIKTCREIIILLKHGYPNGANALLRNLFEKYVIMKFIEQEPPNVAEAFSESANKPRIEVGDYEWARAAECFDKKGRKIKLGDIEGKCKIWSEDNAKFYNSICKDAHASAQAIFNEEIEPDAISTGPTMVNIHTPAINSVHIAMTMLTLLQDKRATDEVKIKYLFCTEWATMVVNWLTMAYTTQKQALERIGLVEKND